MVNSGMLSIDKMPNLTRIYKEGQGKIVLLNSWTSKTVKGLKIDLKFNQILNKNGTYNDLKWMQRTYDISLGLIEVLYIKVNHTASKN
jgi:hypothetical protein